MKVSTQVRHGSENACFICENDLSGEYIEVSMLDDAVALLVCSRSCESKLWDALVTMVDQQ
jgi:hypothetical protein